MVVVIATALTLFVSASQMRSAYRQTLQALFESGARTVVQVRNAELSAVQARCRRLASSPRLYAAMQSGDRQLLSQVADDELREFFLRTKHGAVNGQASEGYMFLDEKSAPIEPGTGTPGLDAAVSNRWRSETQAVREGGEQQLGYIDFSECAYEVLFTSVVDPDDGVVIGTLAVLFKFHTPPVIPVAGGGELRSGLLIGGTLFGDQIPPSSAQTLVQSIDTAVHPVQVGSDGSDDAVQVQIDGEPWLAFRTSLDTSDASVQLVIAASLQPVQAALRKLLFSGVLSGVLGIAFGVAIALVIARGLAKPVAELSAAAQRIGGGDYDIRVAVTRRDEMGLLAERFNEMTHGLSLRDKYRGLLDMVADPSIAEEMLAGVVSLGGVSTPAAVLFCDIRGFTPLTNRLAAHEVVEILNDHMTAMTEVVYRHGGVVDKFVGDLIMAVFGAPKPGTLDAVRAARCGLEMVRSRERMNVTAADPIHIGVGVAFGDMVAGCMGSKQRLNYTVLGERVNLAARLCSMAPAMTVYVDENVCQQLGSGWGVTTMEPLKVKGFSQPVSAFRLDSMENNT